MNNESQAASQSSTADAPASEPTWAQKISAIKLAAERTSQKAVRLVKLNLDEGIEHMEYKDFTEFNCKSEEQYIFGEAVHLIEEMELPFDQALEDVLRTESLAAPDEGEAAQ